MNPTEAIYIHIPFCIRKCNYCDFFSVAAPEKMEVYIDLLIQEIRIHAETDVLNAKSIFIGGGTPTALPAALLEKLLKEIHRTFVTDALREYTVEANPGTITREKLQIMKKYGVNRLSFGVQSDQEERLHFLGRIHTFYEAEEAVRMAREEGFQNINMDFIYGIPGQTTEEWEATLQHAIATRPDHLSLYQLKIEEGTILHHLLEEGKIEEFDDETALEMYRTAQNLLQEHGFTQYEISNYAKKGKESIHNQVYWETENYLGLGMGACSWVRPERKTVTISFDRYREAIQQGRIPYEEVEVLSKEEQMEETAFMALRMNRGISETLFLERFGISIEDAFEGALKNCMGNGWLMKTEGGYCLTEEGRVLGNLVFMEFLAE